MQVIVIPVAFAILGVILGLLSPVTIPITYARIPLSPCWQRSTRSSARSRHTSQARSSRACSSAD
ncbi:MAG TPA: hypothetical protein VJP81_09095 [Candidatus Dormibacteraeota bacterium]|nr:hypothetical protein [Candidatus Dormibacteraeota bacterium]